MNKTDLRTKYEHHLTIKNYSENKLRSYINGLHIFLDYLRTNQINNVTIYNYIFWRMHKRDAFARLR